MPTTGASTTCAPTSVAVTGRYALVAVDTSESFTEPSGELLVIDVHTRRTVARHPLAGQPDSVAVSPEDRWAAVVIENERDEDLVVDGVEGGLPQAPPGLLQVVDLVDARYLRSLWANHEGRAGTVGHREVDAHGRWPAHI